MELSKESLELYLELLNQLSVRPMQQDAEKVWCRVMKAKDEVMEALDIRPVPSEVSDGSSR